MWRKKNYGLKILLILGLLQSCSSQKWWEASRESARIATPAEKQKETIFQIYAARTFHSRGMLAVHPWVAWKEPHEKEYTISHVIGWNVKRGKSSVVTKNDLPDRYWFGKRPHLVFEEKGEKAKIIIKKVKALIEKYPHKMKYGLYPGPNSNSYVQYLIRNTEEIWGELPPHAIGKDYLVNSTILAKSPGGRGFQVSLFGLLGITVGIEAGVEVNILGLNFGVDFFSPALKLPFVGRIGFKDTKAP